MQKKRTLREWHPASCTCSLCHELRHAGHRSFGFLAPQDKTWNAWRWLFYVTRSGIHYWRWTGFWQTAPAVKWAVSPDPEDK